MRIAAVGDIFLADQVACFGHGVWSVADKNGYAALFAHVRDGFRQADLVVGNLECVLADLLPHEPVGFLSLMDRGADRGAAALKEAGIGLVSLANNHIFEHKPAALERTIENLERAGVHHAGSKAKPVHFHEADGRRVAFLSWSLLPDVYWPKLRASDYYNIASDIEEILAEVASVREWADHVVLCLHWGNEFILQPSDEQQELAHRMMDSGVDVILGHHPHVLQPIEEYRGKLVAYSLGNFVSDYWNHPCERSVILHIDLADRMSYRAVPVVIGGRSYAPAPAQGPGRDAIMRLLTDLEPMPKKKFNASLCKIRRRYRLSMLWHMMVNCRKLKRKRDLFLWGMKRLLFILKTRRKAKDDPNVVYEGPMK